MMRFGFLNHMKHPSTIRDTTTNVCITLGNARQGYVIWGFE
jgi:hypothetical protein